MKVPPTSSQDFPLFSVCSVFPHHARELVPFCCWAGWGTLLSGLESSFSRSVRVTITLVQGTAGGGPEWRFLRTSWTDRSCQERSRQSSGHTPMRHPQTRAAGSFKSQE